MPSRSTLEKVATKILTELYEDVDEPEEVEVCEQVHEVQVTTAKTYAQSLQEEIDLETAPKSYDNSLQSKKSLQTEMSLFESTNQRGESLAFLHLTLKNISPTSVACEQGFSLAGNIITTERARLNDQTIDDLCFEKSYYLKEHLYK